MAYQATRYWHTMFDRSKQNTCCVEPTWGDTACIILLMEEFLHHLGCIKLCKSWGKLPTSTAAGFLPSTEWNDSKGCQPLKDPSSSTHPIPRYVSQHVWPHFATPRPPPTKQPGLPGGSSMFLPILTSQSDWWKHAERSIKADYSLSKGEKPWWNTSFWRGGSFLYNVGVVWSICGKCCGEGKKVRTWLRWYEAKRIFQKSSGQQYLVGGFNPSEKY